MRIFQNARYWAPVLLWLALIFILSSIPGDVYPRMRSKWPSYFVHLGLYCVLGFLLIRLLSAKLRLSGPGGGRIILTWALGFAWGISDEAHQEFFVANRGYEWIDLMYDGIGLIVGIFIFTALNVLAAGRRSSAENLEDTDAQKAAKNIYP